MWYPRGKSNLVLSPHQGVYTCRPPTPSSLYTLRSNNFGMMAEREAPVESLMYLPTTPLEFAIPSGKRELFEFNNNRAVSPAEAANITILPLTEYSCKVPVCT